MRTPRLMDLTMGVVAMMGLATVVAELASWLDWYWYAAALLGLVGLVLIYAKGFRSHMSTGHDQRPWPWYVGLVAMSFVAAWGLFSLTALQVMPTLMIWATMRRATTAVLWGTAVVVAGWAGAVVGTSFDPEALVMTTWINAIAWACGLAYGMWLRHTLALATEKTRLYDELRATQDALSRASAHAGALEERSRMSRELHDTLAQSLSGLVMVTTSARDRAADSAVADDLELLEQIATGALADARTIVAELAPLGSTGDAAESVRRAVERVQRESGLQVDLDLVSAPISRELELVLVRCTQEALSNVRKHARADRCLVRLRHTDGQVQLTVSDDGVGPGSSGPSGFGLAGMRDRVALAGGTMTFGPGERGSVLRVVVPLPATAEEDEGAASEPVAPRSVPPGDDPHLVLAPAT